MTGLGSQPYHNVDLDLMHSDLYKGYYHTPEEFLADVLRIQANAEVNKIMEQEAEVPIRAGQMVNHTKVMLDQTFDAHFRSECAKMAERLKEKEKTQPPKKERKGRGRPLPEEGIVAAAKKAAIEGGLLKVRPPDPEAPAAPGADDDVIIESAGDNSLKRTREDGQDESIQGVAGEDGQGPTKRMRADGEPNEEEPTAVASDLADGQAVAASSSVIANGINGYHENGPTSNLNSLLNPTSSSSLTDSQDLPHVPDFASAIPPSGLANLPPPMAVGATPSISPSRSLARPEPSFLSGVPSSTTNPFLAPPTTEARSTSHTGGPPAPNGAAAPLEGVSASHSRDATPTPAAGDEEVEPEKERSPTPIDATPPPLPDFILPTEAIDALAQFLKFDTWALNVDQLEQLRAACFDMVWRGKGDWDRTRLIDEIVSLANEFAEEVEMLTS